MGIIHTKDKLMFSKSFLIFPVTIQQKYYSLTSLNKDASYSNVAQADASMTSPAVYVAQLFSTLSE